MTSRFMSIISTESTIFSDKRGISVQIWTYSMQGLPLAALVCLSKKSYFIKGTPSRAGRPLSKNSPPDCFWIHPLRSVFRLYVGLCPTPHKGCQPLTWPKGCDPFGNPMFEFQAWFKLFWQNESCTSNVQLFVIIIMNNTFPCLYVQSGAVIISGKTLQAPVKARHGQYGG